MLHSNEIKPHFPILSREINGRPLVYLDSAATAQKPRVVVEAISDYYSNHNANVHRGIHTLGDESTKLYQEARETVAKFFSAQADELIFTANTTEALNLVALGWGKQHIKAGQIILVSELEHHSNLVIWQEVCKSSGAKLELVKITQDGQIRLDHLENQVHQFKDNLFLVALTHVSNVTGSVLDIARASQIIKGNSQAKIVLDIAQSAPHVQINFDQSQVDFMAFSGHKLYGPMGTGGLLIKKNLLTDLKPLYYGGGMIDEVFYQNASFAPAPDRYDAGTPNVAGAVGLASAIKFLESIGMDSIETHSRELTQYALEQLQKVDFIEIIGPLEHRLSSVAFVSKKGHAHDVAQILDSQGIAVRSGHHCTMPLHEKMGWGSSVRASFGVYNTREDIDRLVEGLVKVFKIIK